MNSVKAQPTLKFFYFGDKIEYLPDFGTIITNGEHDKSAYTRPVLMNEILYRMQSHVKVEQRTQRTLRSEIHTQTGKPIQVVVPMLVNMQKEGAADVMKQMGTGEDVFFDDVPY